MIKLCIALALLATITLAGNCEYNKLLEDVNRQIEPCTCAAARDLSGTNNYCQKKWNGSSFTKAIKTAPTSVSCANQNPGAFERITTDCLIDGATSSGTVICSNANVYVSASSCPLINKCDQDTVIAGNTAPCLCADITSSADVDLKAANKYCHSTTVTDKPSDCTSQDLEKNSNLVNQKYAGATCMLNTKQVCIQNLVWKKSEKNNYECPTLPTTTCTANVKITGSETCLPEDGSVKVCKAGEYANGFNDACNAMPSSLCSALNYNGLTAYQKWTGADCTISSGSKVCSQDTTYKVDASTCPVLPTTICTPNEKITGAQTVCLAKDVVHHDAVTVCKLNQYADGKTDACSSMPELCGASGGTASKKKNAVVTGFDCQCVTDTVCPADQYCWPGTPNICNAAKKSCATGAPNADTVYSCTGTGWTYVAANSATACPAAGCDDATCCSKPSKPTCSTFDGCGKLDKTTTDCEDAGCDAKTCCQAFSSSKNSALTMGVQTAAFMVIMIFI